MYSTEMKQEELPDTPAYVHGEGESVLQGGVTLAVPLVHFLDGAVTPVRPVECVLKDCDGEGVPQPFQDLHGCEEQQREKEKD